MLSGDDMHVEPLEKNRTLFLHYFSACELVIGAREGCSCRLCKSVICQVLLACSRRAQWKTCTLLPATGTGLPW